MTFPTVIDNKAVRILAVVHCNMIVFGFIWIFTVYPSRSDDGAGRDGSALAKCTLIKSIALQLTRVTFEYLNSF